MVMQRGGRGDAKEGVVVMQSGFGVMQSGGCVVMQRGFGFMEEQRGFGGTW